MRRSVRGCVVVLTAGLTVATVTGAQASATGGKSVEAFCEKAYEVSTANPIFDPNDPSQLSEAARDFAKQYKKLAKLAPAKELRKAAKKIRGYYLRLAESGDATSEDANYVEGEIDAIQTLTEYNVENCADVVPTT